MKTFLKVVAWTGLGFFVVGTLITIYTWISIINYTPGPTPGFGPEAYWLYIIPIDIFGLLQMYVGGLVSRPRYFWLVCMTVGILQISISVPQEWNFLTRSIRERGIEGLSFWSFLYYLV
jgi:hypothetical protein